MVYKGDNGCDKGGNGCDKGGKFRASKGLNGVGVGVGALPLKCNRN